MDGADHEPWHHPTGSDVQNTEHQEQPCGKERTITADTVGLGSTWIAQTMTATMPSPMLATWIFRDTRCRRGSSFFSEIFYDGAGAGVIATERKDLGSPFQRKDSFRIRRESPRRTSPAHVHGPPTKLTSGCHCRNDDVMGCLLTS